MEILKTGNAREVACEYCKAKDVVSLGYRRHNPAQSISKENSFAIYRCNVCEIYFTFPKPPVQELQDFFQNEYHLGRYRKPLAELLNDYPSHRSIFALLKLLEMPVKKLIAKLAFSRKVDIAGIIRRYLNAGLMDKHFVVELGPGICPQVYLEYQGYCYLGVEPSRTVVDIFNRKGYQNIKQGFAENLDFIQQNSVDAIIFQGTLSHVYNIGAVFNECCRVLKTGGVLLIIDNNADSEPPQGSYAYYGLSKAFLSKSVSGFRLLEYSCLDAQLRIGKGAEKMLAVLLKEGSVK